MTIIPFKMPEKLREITVKIVKAPYVVGDVGDDICCDVRIWGDPDRDIFRMKISKTLWHSLYQRLVERYELGGDAGEEIDENLECIVRKVVTIKAIPDINRAYTTKEGGLDSPKIFNVEFREDLEEAERIGGDIYNNAVDTVIINNKACHECYRANKIMAEEKMKKIRKN